MERKIPLTAGNLQNSHFYLRNHLDLFPQDAIGGTNREGKGAPVTVKFEPGTVIETDIDGQKLFFRARAATRDFFERSAAVAGDEVVLEKVGEREFLVRLAPRS